jgi:hypothetical protein
MLADYATLPAILKPLCTRRKPPNPNQKIFFSDEEIFLTRMERQIARMTDRCVLTMRMSPLSCTTRLAEGQPDGPLVEGNVASQLNRL